MKLILKNRPRDPVAARVAARVAVETAAREFLADWDAQADLGPGILALRIALAALDSTAEPSSGEMQREVDQIAARLDAEIPKAQKTMDGLLSRLRLSKQRDL